MKWNDFVNQRREVAPNMQPTNIECPNCDCKIYRRTDIVLATYPPMYQYVCTSCGWRGTAHKQGDERMTVVVDKFTKLQEIIDRIIGIQEMAAQVDNVHERQIEELQRKTERLWYAVVALGTIMAAHIIYHVLPPLMDFFFGL